MIAQFLPHYRLPDALLLRHGKRQLFLHDIQGAAVRKEGQQRAVRVVFGIATDKRHAMRR